MSELCKLIAQNCHYNFVFVCICLNKLGGCGFVMALSTIVLQAPLDSFYGELPSDTQTVILESTPLPMIYSYPACAHTIPGPVGL